MSNEDSILGLIVAFFMFLGAIVGSFITYENTKYDSAISVYKNEIICKKVIENYHCEDVKVKK